MQEKKTVLVTGATGGQGGAVARRLLDEGWAVRALVRNTDGPQAKELVGLGAEPVVGDLDTVSSLRSAARGAHGVFGVLPADLTDPDPEAEVRRGQNLVDAVAAEGVAHFVYSSVAAVGHDSGVSHFETKQEIESYIGTVGIPATVLRPVFIMENWHQMLPAPQNGERVVSFALDADTSLQMIALADIGRIVAETFAEPNESIGRSIDIAGEELTVRAMADVFSRVDAVPTRFELQPIEEVRAWSPEFAAMFAWLDDKGYQVDIAGLRARHPGLLTLEDWRGQGA